MCVCMFVGVLISVRRDLLNVLGNGRHAHARALHTARDLSQKLEKVSTGKAQVHN